MKKYVTVKQTNLYTKEKHVMYKGFVQYCEQLGSISMEYKEANQDVIVCIQAQEDALYITRKGEVETYLKLMPKEQTTGSIHSEFGILELDLYMHKYIKEKNIIAIEYDVLNGDEVSDGFRIMWVVKEEMA